MIRYPGADHLSKSWSNQRSRTGNARPIHGFFHPWPTSVRSARSGFRTATDSTNGLGPGGEYQRQRLCAVRQFGHCRRRQPDFTSSCQRADTRFPFQSVLSGRKGRFDVPGLPAHTSLGSDPSGRGVLRPRFFVDNKNGGNAVLTTGITYEDRSASRLPALSCPRPAVVYRSAEVRSIRPGRHLQRILGG